MTIFNYNPASNPHYQSVAAPVVEPGPVSDVLTSKTHSIDAVIDRVHLVASNINEMTHVAGDSIKKVGDQASSTLSSFNNRFTSMGTEFNKIMVLAREKGSSIPLVLLYIGLVCGSIAIFLAMLQFAAMGFHKLFQTYKYKSTIVNEEANGAAGTDADKPWTSKQTTDVANVRMEGL